MASRPVAGFLWSIRWSFKLFLTDNGRMAFVSGDGGPGNPQVNPAASASLLGNNILIGRWRDQPSKVLFTLSTWDIGDPAWSAMGMDFMASAKDVFWRWIDPANDPTRAGITMDLDYLYRLTLRKRAGTFSQRLILDPELGKITVNGQQVLTALGEGGHSESLLCTLFEKRVKHEAREG